MVLYVFIPLKTEDWNSVKFKSFMRHIYKSKNHIIWNWRQLLVCKGTHCSSSEENEPSMSLIKKLQGIEIA